MLRTMKLTQMHKHMVQVLPQMQKAMAVLVAQWLAP
jgi:hypothetical protein